MRMDDGHHAAVVFAPHPPGGPTVPLLRALLDGGLDDPEAIRIGETAFSGPELLGAAVGRRRRDRRPGQRRPPPSRSRPRPPPRPSSRSSGPCSPGPPWCRCRPTAGRPSAPTSSPTPARPRGSATSPRDVTLPCRRVDLSRRAGHEVREPAGDGTALILYTSGTTGPPKGVLLSADAMAAGLDGLADAWDWTAADMLVHGLPLFHVHGLVLGVLGALRIGSRARAHRPPHAGELRPRRPRARRDAAVRGAHRVVAGRRRPGVGGAPWPTPGCSSRGSRPRCRSRCSSASGSSPGRRRWSATA